MTSVGARSCQFDLAMLAETQKVGAKIEGYIGYNARNAFPVRVL